MGLGGDLMLSAVVREVKYAYPDRKVYLVKSESLYRKAICFMKGKQQQQLSQIFINNPYLSPGKPESGSIVIDRADPKNSYVKKKLSDRFIFNGNDHVVNLICSNYGVVPKSIKPDLFFSFEEKKQFKDIARDLPRSFIALEPNGKIDFTVNRLWFFDKWQELVEMLRKKTVILQVGDASGEVLNNVINYSGRLSFRMTALLLSRAQLFIGTVGGLMHAARAVEAKSIILYSGYEPITMAGYPENINLFHPLDCSPCGLKIKCPRGKKCMDMITVDEVCNAVSTQLIGSDRRQ